MGSYTEEDVIGVYQLKLCLECVLIIHDVVYVPSVQDNLVPIVALLGLWFQS